MIFAELRDAGTKPAVTLAKVPGMDELAYTEVDYEEDIRTSVLTSTNEAMLAADPLIDLAPWPLPLPRMAPADFTQRMRGLQFQLHQWDPAFEAWGVVPGGLAVIQPANDPLASRLDRDQVNLTRELNPAEVREWMTAAGLDASRWLRLPFRNETGGTDLKEPLFLRWQGLQGARYTLELPDNDFYEPFDLTHPERYAFLGEDGKPLEHGELWGAFGDRNRVVVYLRPRRWRWLVTVIAHYEWANWFEDVQNDEVFLSVYYQRPPFYPYRHDLPNASDPAAYGLANFYGEPRSYDQGLESSWDLSWHSIDLRHQILAQQWFSLCEVYVFVGNEDPDLTLLAYPPRAGEIVAGIGFRDELTGRESRVYAQLKDDQAALYPQRTIGLFLLVGWQA